MTAAEGSSTGRDTKSSPHRGTTVGKEAIQNRDNEERRP